MTHEVYLICDATGRCVHPAAFPTRAAACEVLREIRSPATYTVVRYERDDWDVSTVPRCN